MRPGSAGWLAAQLSALPPDTEIAVRTVEVEGEVNATISLTGVIRAGSLVILVGDLMKTPPDGVADFGADHWSEKQAREG